MTQPQWPWPGDSPEDRAKRIALAYRRQLAAVDPLAAVALDDHWACVGAGWVKPATAPLDLDEWLTPGEMADKLHIDPRRMRDWARRNKIRVLDVRGVRKYCVGDVIEYMRQVRLRRVSSTITA
jgi:hypothetical protein